MSAVTDLDGYQVAAFVVTTIAVVDWVVVHVRNSLRFRLHARPWRDVMPRETIYCFDCLEPIPHRWWHRFVRPLPFCPPKDRIRCTRIRLFGRMAK